MKGKAILILVGGRSAVPALVGFLQFANQVNRVKFLVCNGKDYQDYKNNTLKIIQKDYPHIVYSESDVETVNPTKFDEVFDAVQRLCEDVQQLKYANLTTVPQTMAIAVYRYILEQHKNCLVFSVNTNQFEVIPLELNQNVLSIERKITVDNYVGLYGHDIFKKDSTPSAHLSKAAVFIVEKIDVAHNLITLIRRKFGQNIRQNIIKPIKINPMEEKISSDSACLVLQALEEYEIIKDLYCISDSIEFKINDKNYDFLMGKWLEVFVYNAALACEFDSIEMGVELNNYRGEIDVFCVNSANALICECKTGRPESSHIHNLVSKADKLGKDYCVKIFITSEISCDSKSLKDFINQAKNNKIRVILGDELISLTEILSKEMKNPEHQRR